MFARLRLCQKRFSFARDNLPGLVSNLVSNTINKFERKIDGKGAVRAGKELILYISS